MVARKDIISQSLGIEPIEPSGKLTSVIPAIKAERNNDYEYARRNLYDIIEKGQDALDHIVDIAKQSESARAFEVAANLIKTMAETNKDLLALAKQKKELEKETDTPDKQVTNNNLFVGSSAELLKMIKDKANE
jgi:hypothetical protein